MKQGSTENSMAKQSGSERVARRTRGFLPMVLGIALAGVFATAEARAEQTFPAKIQTLANLPCAPTCMLCHTDPAGGLDHMRKAPDGSDWALTNFFFLKTGNGTEADLNKLTLLNSDGDGENDLKELQAGLDPLLKGDAPFCSDIRYGCGARIASKPPLDGSTAAWVLTAAAACVYVGRRRLNSQVR